MSDNRTTELREKLDELGIEYETNDNMCMCETSWHGFTAMQLSPNAKLVMVFTPEQAITATLGSEREKALEELVRDLLQLRCRQSCADCEHENDEGCDFMTRALELGIEVY